jgi:predicted Rossmann fold nucleotide-binding protein DprA/Smf involved in DNA uptake
MGLVQQLLDLSGIGRERMALKWVSAAEGQLFANIVSELTETTKALGHFEASRYSMQLAAIENVIRAPRMRWLTGMDRHITEHENVYGDKIDPVEFQRIAQQAMQDEYQKALILESLKEGPLSVREMAARTGIPVYTVSLRLNDLERRGQAELKGFEGTTAKFVRLAA